MSTLYIGEEIIISNSSTLIIEVVHPDLPSITHKLDYTIIYENQTPGIDFSLLSKSSIPKLTNTSCIKLANLNMSKDLSIYKTAVAYSSLKNNFAEHTYEDYVEYLKTNCVYTLFADEALNYPFPFVFNLTLSPTEYFTIPDMYAAVYIEGIKDYSFENNNLVCKFTIPMATDSDVTIISDYCLRLCIDTIDSNKTSVVLLVWTNIPVGNYISSGSSSVLLSNDGVTFSKIIKLQGSKVYLKGVLPADAEYGYNITNVTIKMVTSEAINEYTF